MWTGTTGEDTFGRVETLLKFENLRLQVIANFVDRIAKALQLFFDLRHVMTFVPQSEPVLENASSGHYEDGIDDCNHHRYRYIH